MRFFGPSRHRRPCRLRQFKLYRPLRLSLDHHDPGDNREKLLPMREVVNVQADKIAAAELALAMVKLNMARSRTAGAFCRWMRIAKMSFGLTGGFWPTSFLLFQTSRLLMASITDFLLVDRSLILRHTWRRQRSGSKLAGWTATTGISTVIAAMQSQTRRGRRRAQGVGKVSIAAEGAGDAGRSRRFARAWAVCWGFRTTFPLPSRSRDSPAS